MTFFKPVRDEEALATYAQVLRLEDDPFYSCLANLNSGTLLASRCRYEEALAAYEEASRLEPNNASIWRHIGDALISLERPDEAKQAYAKAGQPGIQPSPWWRSAVNPMSSRVRSLKPTWC